MAHQQDRREIPFATEVVFFDIYGVDLFVRDFDTFVVGFWVDAGIDGKTGSVSGGADVLQAAIECSQMLTSPIDGDM